MIERVFDFALNQEQVSIIIFFVVISTRSPHSRG